MTNILSLPQLAAATSFVITNTADWLDGIYFAAPGQPPTPISITASIASGTNIVTTAQPIPTTVIPGQPIIQTPGIPASAFIGAITSTTTFTMVDIHGASNNATQTNAQAEMTLMPAPLDLTGITFKAQVKSADGTKTYLTVSTADGTNQFVSGGTGGTLSFNIKESTIANAFPIPTAVAGGTLSSIAAVVDIIAEGDGYTINLFPQGPATLTIKQGVTAP